MLVGPVFTRELATAPRRLKLYFTRAVYVAVFWVLALTAWAILSGTQSRWTVGDLAFVGSILFQVLSPLAVVLGTTIAALQAAVGVAQEKDRGTLVLLLLTRLSNSELVLGKLFASLLPALVMQAAVLPFFLLMMLLGGVSWQQVARVFAVSLACILAAGSLGSTIALWREKTFQALAVTMLALVGWLTAWEILAASGQSVAGVPLADWATCFSPARALVAAMDPQIQAPTIASDIGGPTNAFLLFAAATFVLLSGVAMWRLRIWNPSRQAQPQMREETSADAPAERDVHKAPGKVRPVWDNPILWREMRTWAYGRRILVIRVSYLALVAVAALALYQLVGAPAEGARIPAAARPLVPLCLLSLVLINALAVTSLTTERDTKAIDLLLVTDLTPKEFVFGKMLGVLYNSKEMILLPLLLCGGLYFVYVKQGPGYPGVLSGENFFYLGAGLAVLTLFVSMLGIHVGMTYDNSRSAIAVSIGTVLFLFLGIAVCMRMMFAFNSFGGQLPPFLLFIVGGGVGLYLALGLRNPSPAIGLASFATPLASFYGITSFFLGNFLALFLVTIVTYGFAVAAMLIPALSEFDVAVGRTTADGD